MTDFVGFMTPRKDAAASDGSLARLSQNPSHAPRASLGHGAPASQSPEHVAIRVPALSDSDGAAPQSEPSGIGHGSDVSPAMMVDPDRPTLTPVILEDHSATAARISLSQKQPLHKSSFYSRPTGSLAGAHVADRMTTPLMGHEPPVPRVFLSYAFAHNSFFARRLLRVSASLATVMVAGVVAYYGYRPKSIVLNPLYPTHYGFILRDAASVYTLQATSCENMVGFSALVFHTVPIVILLGLPATGLRTFEPFKRQPLRDDDGNRNTIKRMHVFQCCELVAVMLIVFCMVVFWFFWYMFFNGAAFACNTLRVHFFAACALACYAGMFVQLIYFARYREHIKMQLGAFKESDQTGNVRKHLVDPAAAELMNKDNQLITLIQKRLYKATSLGDLREMRTVLELARAKKLDEKGFPMKYYGNARIYLRCFGQSKKNPVHVAAYNGNIEALELLRSFGFETTTLDKFSRVRFSTGDLFWYFAHYFVSKPAVSDEDDAVSVFKTTLVTPLHCAVSTGQLEAVRWLIAHGAEVGTIAQSSYRSERVPPIFLAETPSVVRELLENGANHLVIPDPGYMNTLTALQLAYLRGNFSVAQELEEWGCDVALTPFHSAAAMNDTARMRSFIRRGTNLNCLGEHGYVGMNRRTPLHWAAVSGSEGTVDLLLEAGADANFQDASGRTPLHWAARLNKLNIVKSLLAKGAMPNVPDEDQMTPLMCAANARHATRELFSVLVEAGADINYQLATTGDTALHMAVRAENAESALALLACGGNIMQVNHDGLRPLDCSTDTKLLFAIKRAAGHRDVMISYTHSHAEFAKKLRKSLEDANVTTWLDLMDPSGIGGGSVWREEIARGITHAALVVCILTEDYAASEWCLKELALAKQVGTPILAVSTESVRIGEELQVYLYTRQIIPFEPAITEIKRNVENPRQIEYEYTESKYKSQFNLLLDGVRDEIEKRREVMVMKGRAQRNLSGNNLSIVSTGFSKMFQPWDVPGTQYVFISHGDRHARFVHRLCQELKARDITFYGDRNVEGQTFDERIHVAKEAILKCTAFIVILSKETMSSELVRDQLAFAEDKGRPMVPIVLSDVEIGFDKQYSLARTDVFHFLNDGFAFTPSFNHLFSGLQRHYNATTTPTSADKKPAAAATSFANTSFANASFMSSNGSFTSFLETEEPARLGGSSMASSSFHSSFMSENSEGDPIMGKCTPYVVDQEAPAGSRLMGDRIASVIQEADEPEHESDRGSQTSDMSYGDLEDGVRNFSSLSSLASEDREHLELVRM